MRFLHMKKFLISSCFLLIITLLHSQDSLNLSFEQRSSTRPLLPDQWAMHAPGYEIILDSTDATEGKMSLRIEQTADRATRTIAYHFIPIYVNDLTIIDITANIKTQDVENGGAALVVQVLNRRNEQLFFDDMRNRNITGTTPWKQYSLKAIMDKNATGLLFGLLKTGTGFAWYDDFSIEMKEIKTLDIPNDEMVIFYEDALILIRSHSLYKQNIDWDSNTQSSKDLLRGVKRTSDIYPYFRCLFGQAGDNESYIIVPDHANRTIINKRNEINYNKIKINREILDNQIVYLQIMPFDYWNKADGQVYATRLQKIISESDTLNPRGWIIDIRSLSNGSLWPVLTGLGPILGEGILLNTVNTEDEYSAISYSKGRLIEDNIQLLKISGKPAELISSSIPVAVLIHQTTADAGEAVAIAFKNRENTKLFGNNTTGLSTCKKDYQFRDGSILHLSTTWFTDQNGNKYRGPVKPDEVTEWSRNLPLNRDPAIQSAVKWLISMNK